MRTVYTVPINGATAVMNARLARFIAEHMNKLFFQAECIERYEKAVVCQQNARIIGCALLRKLSVDMNQDHADLMQNPDCMVRDEWDKVKLERHIECVCVHRDYRNQGIGSEVMQAAVEEWQKELCLSTDVAEDVVLWIDHHKNKCDLLRFYERLNFKVILERNADSKLCLQK